MKLYFTFALGLVLLSVKVFADPDPAFERLQRMMHDPVLTAVIVSTEEKDHLQCKLPAWKDIQWRCLNGPQCGYEMQISCVGEEPLQIEVNGFDTGSRNDILSLKFIKARE